MRVAGDPDICMRTGICVMTADGFFDQDDDGAVLLAADQVSARDERAVRNAVRMCPSGALRILAD
ncbi:ferredoxin [Mycolicibacterium moriokaense]|nr:ferredoxin [Mycolicibacterium moriokaense]